MALVIGGWTFRPELFSLRPAAGARPSAPVSARQEAHDREFAQRRFVAKSVELRESLVTLQAALGGVRGRARGRAAHVSAAVDLGGGVATRLGSSAQIATATRSFAPLSPVWQGDSRADPTVSGSYDGAQGSGTLTVAVTVGGVRRSSEVRLELRSPANELVEEIVLAPADPINTLYPLSNGLVLQFAGGRLTTGDAFTIDVRNDRIDPDAPFDGTRGDPGFDAGEAVRAGSFLINGVTIEVLDSDSVNGVLDRIERSAAGVTAAYDPATETVTLEQKTRGAQPSITIAGDTSGFVAAVKLDDGTLVRGSDAGADTPIGRLAAFAGVTSGSVTLNGVAIPIDPSVDSLADIVARIDASAAGVSARLVRNQSLVISNDDPRAELSLSSNDTGLFEAVRIVPGVYAPSASRAGASQSVIDAVVDATRDVARAYERFFGFDPYVAELPEAQRIRGAAATAFANALRAAKLDEQDLGVRFDTVPAQGLLEIRSEQTLRARLRTDLDRVRTFYVGADDAGSGGFVGRLSASIGQQLAALPASVRSGALFDRLV